MDSLQKDSLMNSTSDALMGSCSKTLEEIPPPINSHRQTFADMNFKPRYEEPHSSS